MNLQTSAVAVQPSAFPNNMPNVIDSLKRLERIGSEESQTVQKILEAASELSETITKYFPASLQDMRIVAHVDDEGNIRLGEWEQKPMRRVVEDGQARMLTPKAQHVFSVYTVISVYRNRLMLLRDDEQHFVGSDRETALIFSKDIAHGLLEAINQFIDSEHRASEEGLKIVASAAEGLKALNKPDSDEAF
jgi:hypothetical protein